MTSSLTELLAARRRLAIERATELAALVPTGDSRSVGTQTEIEEALGDVRHYSELSAALGDVAADVGVYNRHSLRSIVGDLRSGTVDAHKRLTASHRALAADGVELRDVGAGTTIAAVPAWLIEEARPTAIKRAPILTTAAKPLPPRTGLDIRLPQFSTEPVAAPQVALNSALTTATFADDAASAKVRTFGVQVDIAVQFIEQSPLAVDQHVIPTLIAAVDAAAEASLFAGDGTGGHLDGILSLSGRSAETYTDATPTLVEAVPVLEALVRKVEAAADGGGAPVVVMHPRRLSWFRQTAIAEGRDLGWTAPPIAGAAAGWFGGAVAVVADSAIPTNLGAGTNEDVIVVMRSLDALDLYASTPRVQVAESVGASSTLTSTITVSKMVAFTGDWIPASFGVMSGTGLALT